MPWLSRRVPLQRARYDTTCVLQAEPTCEWQWPKGVSCRCDVAEILHLLSTRKRASKPRKLNAWSDGRSDRRKALPWIEIKLSLLYLFNSFSEELNYLGSLSPYMRERAENDERYLAIETNHLRLLLGVSESLCNASRGVIFASLLIYGVIMVC